MNQRSALSELPVSRVPIGDNFSVLQSDPLRDQCSYFVGQFFSTAVFGFNENPLVWF